MSVRIRLIVISLVAALLPGVAAAEDATQCVSIERNISGGGDLKNNCPYVISVTWCVVGHDCKNNNQHIWSNLWNIGAGRTYPAIGSAGGKRIEYAACKGKDVYIKGTGNKQFICK